MKTKLKEELREIFVIQTVVKGVIFPRHKLSFKSISEKITQWKTKQIIMDKQITKN